MKENNIRPKQKDSSRLILTHNILNGNFNPTGPNQAWVADITYIPTDEGWLYFAAVDDLFNRKIVGWVMDSTMTKELVVSVLDRLLEDIILLRE